MPRPSSPMGRPEVPNRIEHLGREGVAARLARAMEEREVGDDAISRRPPGPIRGIVDRADRGVALVAEVAERRDESLQRGRDRATIGRHGGYCTTTSTPRCF